MHCTGFADEAASGLERQIAATKALGWNLIEARKIDGTMIHDLDEAAFERACATLAGSGVSINCFGSAVANWAKQIDEPMDSSLTEVERCIPRMQRLGCKRIRLMSFALRKDRGPEDQAVEERIRRLRILVGRLRDAGLEALHENCNNYGGMGPSYTLRLLEGVPGLKLVFDTGNPVFTDDMERLPGPDGRRPKQDAWDFYRQVRDHIAYVHIKDGIWDPATQKTTFTWPGEGQGQVRRIVTDLLARGYDGGFSMEPHLAVVHHDSSVQSPEAIRYANYVEYGRRFERLLDECRPSAP